MVDKSLIRKYNVQGPRYTSYPTVPYWSGNDISVNEWVLSMQKSFNESINEGISIYIHLPFCENLCTFCGCHKRITKRHEVEEPYIQALIKEWNLYLELFSTAPKIKEIHLGGGTPTFFKSENLNKLINTILASSKICNEYEFSFEGHPNHTTKEQLQSLYDLGFRRNSFGVQDYDPKVQKAINRIQPFENVERVHNWSKQIGYTSISHDLVFGLPHQNQQSIIDTISKTNILKPDRISYYSYAHVPWIKGVGQRGFDDNDLPKDEDKRLLYELGKELFDKNGYYEIGMDHFALPTDSMYKSLVNKKLHRNFMGYTTNNTKLMIGLGMSSISDSWYGFVQNEKTVEDYEKSVNNGVIPIFRGHLLTDEDLIIRRHILNIMCHFETDLSLLHLNSDIIEEIKRDLSELIDDNLVVLKDNKLTVTQNGIPFVRNICMAFDIRLKRDKPKTQVFSKTI